MWPAMNRRTLLRILGLPALGTAAGGWIAMAAKTNRYYQGPPSDHFDGQVFFNPGRRWRKSPLDLLKWQLLGKGNEPWPAEFPSPHRDVPPARVEGEALRVSFVGHASLLLQTHGLNLLLDPVWSDRVSPVRFAGPRRVNAPGIAFDDLPPIDVVLLSHNHYDHMDVDTLRRLAVRDAPRVVTPLGNDTILREAGVGGRIDAHDWGDAVALNEAVTVHLEEALHWSARGMTDRLEALWAAFVIEAPGGPVYFAGDTGFGGGAHFAALREKHGPPRLALLPIGAYEPRWFMKEQHMDPDEAVLALKACEADHAVAIHWGTFKLTDEGIERPLEALATALDRHGVEPARFRALRPGEAWEVPARVA
jgi:L-ascorbate metabolism protein UlaG (beta-lactamase superfamily)